MTKVITRYIEAASLATAVKNELLYRRRVPPSIVRTFSNAEGLADALIAADVDPDTAQKYQDNFAPGGTVLMIRAGYKPLGVAKMTRDVLAAMGATPLPGAVEEVAIKDQVRALPSLLEGGPLLMTRRRDPNSTRYHMADWPIPLLAPRRPSVKPAFPPHARMASWPIDLLLPGTKRYGRFPFDYLAPRHVRYGRFPFDLLAPSHVRYGRFPFDLLVPGHKFMAKFPFDHLVPGHKFMAKFPFGHLVPGHRRMANWPFPLLINGKAHTNSLAPSKVRYGRFPIDLLVPGHKFMAKFPIAHLAPSRIRYGRFPFGLLVPGHKFMAKFPFDHIVPGHKHQANFPIPLLVGHSKETNKDWAGGFTISKIVGIPTVIRRKAA